MTNAVQAQGTGNSEGSRALILPELGNNKTTDRLLLREIGDQHVFNQNLLNIAQASVAIPHARAEGLPTEMAISSAQAEASTVWEFVRQSRRLVIPENDRISHYLQQYRDEAMWVSKIMARATPYSGHIVDALDERFLPVELALLPAIESGFQPDVHSAREAAGIWQIVPGTASEIGLRRTMWVDGRADIVESTTAALDYLSYLNAEFHGDWLLTLAAYNAGPGRVRSAIRQNRKLGLPLDFWSLKLPRETRNYVPKFLALVAMLREGEKSGLEIPRIPRGDGFEVVKVNHRISLEKLAETTGLEAKSLKLLNAGLVHGVTPPDGPHRVYVRKGHGDKVRQRIRNSSLSSLFSPPSTYKVVKGDTLSGIAQRFGLSQKMLMSMNALENTNIFVNQVLAIKVGSLALTDTIEYIVTVGDTLSDIAQRFDVNVANIRDEQGNALNSDLIHPGERLSIQLVLEQTG